MLLAIDWVVRCGSSSHLPMAGARHREPGDQVPVHRAESGAARDGQAGNCDKQTYHRYSSPMAGVHIVPPPFQAWQVQDQIHKT
jgi:hypothetical protein